MNRRRGPDRLFFDLWSNIYDAPLAQRLTYRPEHDAVMSALLREPPGRVLDVGCGTGILTERIQQEFARARVAGCDFSSGMLRQAARRRSGPDWVRANALQLPFVDQSWDAVVSTEAFHWFPNQGAALREFLRVLRPGGRLLVSLINPPLEAISRITRRSSAIMGQPLYWPTRARMRAQVERAGFRVESQRRIFRVPAGVILPSVITVGVRPD